MHLDGRTVQGHSLDLDADDLIVLQLLSDESPDAGASFKIGDRSVQRTEYLRWLLQARRDYVLELTRMPVWEATVLHPQSRR